MTRTEQDLRDVLREYGRLAPHADIDVDHVVQRSRRRRGMKVALAAVTAAAVVAGTTLLGQSAQRAVDPIAPAPGGCTKPTITSAVDPADYPPNAQETSIHAGAADARGKVSWSDNRINKYRFVRPSIAGPSRDDLILADVLKALGAYGVTEAPASLAILQSVQQGELRSPPVPPDRLAPNGKYAFWAGVNVRPVRIEGRCEDGMPLTALVYLPTLLEGVVDCETAPDPDELATIGASKGCPSDSVAYRAAHS